MNKKFVVAAVIVLVASLLVPTSAFASWTGVSGQLMDGKTGSNWTFGGTVFVFDCSNMNGAPLGSAAANGTGSFTVAISSSGVDRFLCIQATFNAVAPFPQSADYWKVLQDVTGNTGTRDAGIFYTDTGPTAITLRDLNATSTATPWPLVIGAVVVVAAMLALGLVLRRRTAKA